MPKLCNVVVLISGSGSNLQALIDSLRDGATPARIRAVISNRADAYGLERARQAGIQAEVLDHKAYADRESFDQALAQRIDAHEPHLVILAGFMRILSADFVRHYQGRLLNIHPSLLPRHKGLHTHQRALEAGDREHGCSVHFVTEELDGGPLVVQAVIPVESQDTPERLARRVHEEEHRIYRWPCAGSPRAACAWANRAPCWMARPCLPPAIRFAPRRFAMRKAMLFLLTLLTLPAYAFELKPFTASYTADWKQMPISGNASRSLKALGDGRWQLDFEASMLLASLNEVSTFKVENDTFLPQTYRFARQGLGKGKQIELDFDWSQKQVLGSDRGDAVRQPLNRGQLDKSTYQLVLQHDVADGKKSMSYQIIEGEDVDTYDFRVLGEEKVRTQAGLINAIKVERVRDPGKSNRKTILWFAKDWDYLLVRLYQMETDGKEYQIMLKEGTIDGKTVTGEKS